MFSFFQRKYFLVDYLEGLTDFHNHILPGLDDGAKDVSESKALLNKFSEFGVTKFVCTPHVMGDYYPNTPETINLAKSELLTNLNGEYEINASAEYMMDQQFLEILAEGQVIPISQNNILVEMSYFQPPINLNEILFKIQNRSFRPILAHPERYGFYHSKSSPLKKYDELKSLGCDFQLNMLALSNHYGSGIQKTAFHLLENDRYDYLSSDTHRMDHLEKLQQIKISKKHLPRIESLVDNSKNLFSR